MPLSALRPASELKHPLSPNKARRGLRVAGTLSVLDEAEEAGLVTFDDAVAELQKTTFRVSQAVLAEIKAKRSR